MLTFVGDKDVVIISMMMMDQVDCASASVPLKRVTRKVKAKNSCAKNKSRMWVARLVMMVMMVMVVMLVVVMVVLVMVVMVIFEDGDISGDVEDGNFMMMLVMLVMVMLVIMMLLVVMLVVTMSVMLINLMMLVMVFPLVARLVKVIFLK